MIEAFLGIALLIVCIDGIMALLWQKDSPIALLSTPKVSILLAVRNEETHILTCLASLHRLHYPSIEILIGNDASTDQTTKLIETFIADKPHFQLFEIKENMGLAIGKANVLAQLAQKASGQWLFFTDADMQHPTDWVENMLSFGRNHDLMIGFTWVTGEHYLARMQALDWTFALGVAKFFADNHKPITAMGNNMATRKSAYCQTGGYEKLPSSLVEDFTLLQALKKHQKTVCQVIHHKVKTTTQAASSWRELLAQRRRWMSGALQAPWHAQAYVYVRVIFFFLLIIATVYCQAHLPLLLCIWGVKVLFQTIFIIFILKEVNEKISIFWILCYEFFSLTISIALPFYYIFQKSIFWKNRRYY